MKRGNYGPMIPVCLLILLIGTLPSLAQMPTATILGVVKDASGAVVPETNIGARNVETGQIRTTVTAADGSYRLPALNVGPYEIRAEHPGFQSALRTGLTLTVSEEAVVNIVLQLGAVEQTVAVTAEAPLVNTTSGSLGGLVDQQKVADLPLNGRNYIDLTLLQSGVQESRTVSKSAIYPGTWFSSNGSPLKSNNYMLDGAMMTTVSSGSTASVSGYTLGVEGIREYRVMTNSFSAEYGMMMGSQMMIVSKNGTNSFHGSLFEYLRNSALDARNFFDYKSAVNQRRLPAFSRNNFGAAAGGPIQKDKTFFYGVYEGVRERIGVTTVSNTLAPSAKVDGGLVPVINPIIKPLLVLFPDPNLPGNKYTFPFTQPTRDDYGQMRVDRTFSSNDNAFVRYTIDDAAVTTATAFPNFTDGANSRNQFTTLSESHVFSPTLLNTARLSYSRTNTFLFSDWPRSQFTGPQFIFSPGEEMGTITITGVATVGANATNPRHNSQNLFTLSDDVFMTRGKSSWKFGMLINSYRQYIMQTFARGGTINFPSPTAFLLGQPSSLSQRGVGSLPDRTFRFYTLGFYAQNDWKAAPRLTLNLGLRYEVQTQTNEVHGKSANLRDVLRDAQTTVGIPFRDTSWKNFSPRFGFAWDVTGNGKTAVRGGFGMLYDLANNASALLGTIAGTPPFGSFSTQTNPTNFTIPFQIPASFAGKALRIMDFNLQQPHMLVYNLTVERQLPFSTAITVTYAHSRGLDLLQKREGNPARPQVLADGRMFWTGTESRQNPNWTTIDYEAASADSYYNSLQFGVSKRMSRGLQFQSSFTWGKVIDDTQGQNTNESGGASSPVGASAFSNVLDRGLANFDVKYNWHFNAIYRLPDLLSSGSVTGKFLNGWALSSILSIQGGQPFTPALANDRARDKVSSSASSGPAGIQRPDLVPGRSFSSITQGRSTGCGNIPAGTPLGTPSLWFDPCAFTLPPVGFLGNTGRNILRLPGFATVDFSVMKDARLRYLGEAGRLEFRAEAFNLLNRANFGVANRTVFSGNPADATEPYQANAGVINSTLGAARQIQFALKVIF